MADWYRVEANGVSVTVRLTPKGGADRLEGAAALADGTGVLVARVRAAPEKGAANAALEKLIAKALGVAPTSVAVASGHKARLKTVHVAAQARTLQPRLDALADKKEGQSR